MAMPKGRTLDKYEPHSLSDCLAIPYKAIQRVAEKFMSHKEYTVTALAEELSLSHTNVREQIYYLQKHKLIHIARWGKTTSNNWAAIYKAGNTADAPVPSGVNTLVVKAPPPPPEPVVTAAPPPSYFKELAHALVPMRDEQARREVNWMYWKYLAGEAA